MFNEYNIFLYHNYNSFKINCKDELKLGKYYNTIYKELLTLPELQLSTSDQRESGLEDRIHRPLMHQPVNYPDVRIVWKHKFKLGPKMRKLHQHKMWL